MLPDIRAVIAAIAAAIGLLAMAFALVAAFRIAQDRSSPLQSELSQRNHLAFAQAEPISTTLIVEASPVIVPAPVNDTAARAEIPPAIEPGLEAMQQVRYQDPETARPAATEIAAKQSAAIEMATPAQFAALLADAPPPPPAAEPPVGGPLSDRIAAVHPAQPDLARADRAKRAKIAAIKAATIAAETKARATRIARERRAATRRAAARHATLARAAHQNRSQSFNAPRAEPFEQFNMQVQPKGLTGSFGSGF